jgi:acyl carrier protein
MQEDEIKNKVKKEIAFQLGIKESQVHLDSTLKSLGADSLDIVEIVMQIEIQFNVNFNENIDFTTVHDIVEAVKSEISFIPQKQFEQEDIPSLTEIDALLKSDDVEGVDICDQESEETLPINHNKRWEQEDDDKVILMFAARSSVEVIAQELGRSVSSILHRLAIKKLLKYDHKEAAYYTTPSLFYKV